MGIDATSFRGHDLVGRDGNRANFFLGSGVLADFIGGQGSATEKFITPLSGRHGICHQNQSGRFSFRHCRRADDGLSGSAGKHDNARTAMPEPLDCMTLVVANLPSFFAECDLMEFAVHITGRILCRPTNFQQRLLDVSALAWVHGHRVSIDPLTDQRLDPL
ncbi:hypothetical protein GALL_407190 [mine drainage metagenome]|uniref:Uncharacterized protein n=1 Tax=mine drainage metagenome TaxID=410659 RepID=A0A1J5QC73_9ZZZZ